MPTLLSGISLSSVKLHFCLCVCRSLCNNPSGWILRESEDFPQSLPCECPVRVSDRKPASGIHRLIGHLRETECRHSRPLSGKLLEACLLRTVAGDEASDRSVGSSEDVCSEREAGGFAATQGERCVRQWVCVQPEWSVYERDLACLRSADSSPR